MGGGGGLIKKLPQTRIVDKVFGISDSADALADATQRAAMSQQSEARRQRDEIKMMSEGVTVEGLANMDKALKLQEKNLSRQEQLISQIDPTIIEASQQALKLLRGEQASTLAPLKNQRERQRQRLLNNLREQLGPGAETSTAGIQALTRFDAETDSLFAGAQQQALSGMGSIAGQFNTVRPDMLNEIQGFGNIAMSKPQLKFNQIGLMSGANQNLMNTAGAQHSGAMVRAQQQNAMSNMLLNTAVQGGMAYATGGASLGMPKAPTAGG